MTTLADCFPQSKTPPKLKVGMVISYRNLIPPYLIVVLPNGETHITQYVTLVKLDGLDVWNRGTSTRSTRNALDFSDISAQNIKSALGFQSEELHNWRIWTKEEVSEWFLKNYPSST